MGFKEECAATGGRQYFLDVYENRGDFKPRLADSVCVMDGHAAELAIFKRFYKLFSEDGLEPQGSQAPLC